MVFFQLMASEYPQGQLKFLQVYPTFSTPSSVQQLCAVVGIIILIGVKN